MFEDADKVRPGDVIDGRYEIVSSLGQGGMGQVFQAQHVGIKRGVAIKILHAELRAQPEVNNRIMREAFATGRLDHPNCVSITDSGTLEDGTTYLVMELLKGQSLGDELDDRQTLPLIDALAIARDVLRGLAHAHSVGVVHRDLKPDNIFLVQTEDGVMAKVLDFGIAKLVGDARAEEGGMDLTEAGMAIGSPTYMSPEQAVGNSIDGRTDIYSASLVLYEMLVGEPPFYEPDDKVRSLQRRLKEEPPLMKSPRGEAIPPAVELLIREGLAKEPVDRIADADVYASRIEDLLAELCGSSSEREDPTPVLALSTGEATATPPPPHGAAPAVQSAQAASQRAQAPEATGLSAPPISAQARRSSLTRSQKRLLLGGLGGLLMLVVLIAAVASSGDSKPRVSKTGEKDGALEMSPDHLEDKVTIDPALLAAQLEGELAKFQAEIDAERGPENITSLQKLELLWPDNARIHRLLGLAYMQKRFWNDGYKHLRQALELDEGLRSDPQIIQAALRSLSSRSKPELGQRFLVQNVGQPAIPFLEETAKGGTKRQREYAQRALRQLRAAKL